MTRRMVLLAVLALVGFAAAPGAAGRAVDITGKWTATFDTPIGQQVYTYDFVVKAGVLTGTATGNMGRSDITEGKVDGASVTFVELLDGQYPRGIHGQDHVRRRNPVLAQGR